VVEEAFATVLILVVLATGSAGIYVLYQLLRAPDAEDGT